MLSVMLVLSVPVSEEIYEGSFMTEILRQLHSIVPVKVTKPHLEALPHPSVCVSVCVCVRVPPVTMVTQALRLTSRLALALRTTVNNRLQITNLRKPP